MEFNLVNPYDLEGENLKSYLKRVVRLANDRLLKIEKKGVTEESYPYQRAIRELENLGRRRFSYKFNDPAEMIKEIARVESFITNKASTLSGLKEIQKTTWGQLRTRYLDKLGIDMQSVGLNQRDFYKFLNSQAGKDMVHDYGSDFVIEDVIKTLFQFRNKKYTLEDVIKDYRDFMKEDNLSFDAVDLKRRGYIETLADYTKLKEKLGYK